MDRRVRRAARFLAVSLCGRARPTSGHARRGRRAEEGRGQSMIELALLMPALCFLLLAVVDFAQASSV